MDFTKMGKALIVERSIWKEMESKGSPIYLGFGVQSFHNFLINFW